MTNEDDGGQKVMAVREDIGFELDDIPGYTSGRKPPAIDGGTYPLDDDAPAPIELHFGHAGGGAGCGPRWRRASGRRRAASGGDDAPERRLPGGWTGGFQPPPPQSQPQVTTSANKLVGRTGRFWEREYYDRITRDSRDYDHTIRYILDNPVKGGRHDWRWVWPRF